MQIRRVTARHTVTKGFEGTQGETTVEVIGEPVGALSLTVEDVLELIDLATVGAHEARDTAAEVETPKATIAAKVEERGGPPAEETWTPPAEEPHIWRAAGGWWITCPGHGNHAARLFEARNNMPAKVKCTAKDDDRFCSVGASPPVDNGGRS